jgi:chromosome segregation ATPase
LLARCSQTSPECLSLEKELHDTGALLDAKTADMDEIEKTREMLDKRLQSGQISNREVPTALEEQTRLGNQLRELRRDVDALGGQAEAARKRLLPLRAEDERIRLTIDEKQKAVANYRRRIEEERGRFTKQALA